jgi:hypothetical protein
MNTRIIGIVVGLVLIAGVVAADFAALAVTSTRRSSRLI